MVVYVGLIAEGDAIEAVRVFGSEESANEFVTDKGIVIKTNMY